MSDAQNNFWRVLPVSPPRASCGGGRCPLISGGGNRQARRDGPAAGANVCLGVLAVLTAQGPELGTRSAHTHTHMNTNSETRSPKGVLVGLPQPPRTAPGPRAAGWASPSRHLLGVTCGPKCGPLQMKRELPGSAGWGSVWRSCLAMPGGMKKGPCVLGPLHPQGGLWGPLGGCPITWDIPATTPFLLLTLESLR